MYVSVADKAAGSIFTEADWDTFIRDNLNKGVMRPIAEATLAAPAASIDFTSIAADWSHLLLMGWLGSDTGSSIGTAIRFNGDSTAIYDRQYVAGNAAVASASEALAQTSIQAGLIHSAIGASPMMLLIPNYASTLLGHKPLLGLSGFKTAVASAGLSIYVTFGSWRSAAAINQVTLFPGSGNFATGSKIALCGIGGI